MAITKEWEINTLDRDISDGYVVKAIYRVKGLDGGTEKDRQTGEVSFTKPEKLPSDFVEYAKLDEATVLNWVKTALGTDTVTAIEKTLEDNINLINTPVQATGKPWS